MTDTIVGQIETAKSAARHINESMQELQSLDDPLCGMLAWCIDVVLTAWLEGDEEELVAWLTVFVNAMANKGREATASGNGAGTS